MTFTRDGASVTENGTKLDIGTRLIGTTDPRRVRVDGYPSLRHRGPAPG